MSKNSLRLWMPVAGIGRDLKYAFRVLRENPSFAVVVLGLVALGISTNTAMFSLADTVLLRELPVKDPSKLVAVARNRRVSLSYPLYLKFDQLDVFDGLLAHSGPRAIGLSTRGDVTELVTADLVSGNYFSVLGVGPALGRLLSPADDSIPGAHPVVNISHSLWERRFGADPRTLGRVIDLNGYPVTIIGITARGFSGTDVAAKTDVFAPLSMTAQIEPALKIHWNSPNSSWLEVIGRLGSHSSIHQAQSRLDAVFQNDLLGTAIPVDRKVSPGVVTPHIRLLDADKGVSNVRTQLSQPLVVLLSITGMLLLVTCTNLASLMLARSVGRRREVGIRLAIGASRIALARQFIVEGLIISLLGGLAGFWLTFWSLRILARYRWLGYLPFDFSPVVDSRLLFFTLGLCVVTGMAFSVVPAWHAARLHPANALRDGVPGTPGDRFLFRKLLVTLQVAMSLILLIGAGLFSRTMARLHGVDPGFLLDNVLTIDVDPIGRGDTPERAQRFYQEAMDRIGRLPGVKTTSLAFVIPLSGNSIGTEVSTPDREVNPAEDRSVNVNLVAPHYFETMGIPLLAGRDFAESDMTLHKASQNETQSERVVVISLSAARYFLNDNNPIGKQLCLQRSYRSDLAYTIVGVVGDARYRDLRVDPARMAYRPTWSEGGRRTLCLNSAYNPAGLGGAIRRELAAIDPAVPIVKMQTMREQWSAAVIREHMVATLGASFSLITLGLSAIGLYGLMSSVVSSRTKEIAIRLAMGAHPAYLVGAIIRDAMVPVLIGIIIGVPIAFTTARLAKNLLFGVSAYDQVSILGAVIGLGLTAALASYFPARRIAGLEPAACLRSL